MKIFDVKANRYVESTDGDHLFIMGSIEELRAHFKDEDVTYEVNTSDDISRINYDVHMHF